MKKIIKKFSFFQIIIVALTVFLVLNISVCIFAFYNENKEDKFDSDTLVYSLTNQNYTYIMGQCYRADLEEIEKDPNAYEFYCISKYFENASLYKTYLGFDDEKSQEYKENMDEYAKGILKFDYTIDEINQIFDIK